MPFKSEKQRRYLWATQPELAKRWAHKYPESNKGLPMYADEKKEEKTAHNPAFAIYVNNCVKLNRRGYSHKPESILKTAEDATYRVKLPNSGKPTYAGQEEHEGAKPQIQEENAQVEQREPENAINSLLQKIAIVLSRPMAQRLENRKARREQRNPAYQPKNRGIRQYAVPSPYTPLPMGMQPQQAPQPQQTAANTQVSQPANTPSANPINAFGALSSTGNINGNAAFGQKNSPDSSKTAGVASIGRNLSDAAGEQGVDPVAAATIGLLGAGALYGTYYGGKKLLSPLINRMNLRTLPPEEVAPFSLPIKATNQQHTFAERYREPGIIGGFYMPQDSDNISEALLTMAAKRPGANVRLENHEFTPDDLDFAGKVLAAKYPQRYRLPTKHAAATHEKAAVDPIGVGVGLGAAGLGGLGLLGAGYFFGNGPNSRAGQKATKELTDYWAAQKKMKYDQYYKQHMGYRNALQSAPTEENVRNYLKHWGSKGFKSDDDWEDLEEDLPFKPFNTPGAFEADYLIDDLHTDIGNRLRDPKQFNAALQDLLPRLNLQQKKAGGNNDGLAELQAIDADLLFINDPEYLDYEDYEMFDKTAALQDIYSKWAADANFNLVYPKHKPSYVMPKHLRDNVLKPEEAQQVLRAMRTEVPHGALDNTRLDWHGLKIRGYSSRVQDNDKITNLGRWMHHTVGDEFESTHPDKTQGFGDAFLPSANVVSVPSGMGGTLMHELGHAIDFNAFPSNSTARHLLAATYRNYAPTLWHEHAAWHKGRKNLLSAFANNKLDPALTHKILTNAAGTKRVGLGSYWGGALGGTLGAGAGLAGAIALSELARKNDVNVRIGGRLAALPVILGGALGVMGGTGIGHWMARQPVKSEKIVNIMAKSLAQKQNMPYEQARQRVEAALATKQKPAAPIRKAASILNN